MKTTARILNSVSLVGLLLGMCLFCGSHPVRAAGVGVGLNAPAEVVSGGTFSVSVDIGAVTAFDAGQFDVSFDGSVLQLDSVGEGQIGATVVPVDMWNQVGAGTYRIIVNVPGVPGVDGSGQLAVLHFSVADSAAGSSTLTVSNGFINNNLGVEVPATWSGDSVFACEDLLVTTSSVPDGTVGSAYSASLAATGGNGTRTWSLVSGSMPDGLGLSASGTMSGTPTTAGFFTFTVGVTDGYLSDTKTVTMTVNPRTGDANGDGLINSADITKVERIIVGLDAATPGADVNGDGNINSADVTKIERRIAGLE